MLPDVNPSPDAPTPISTLVPPTHILVPLALFNAMAQKYWGSPERPPTRRTDPFTSDSEGKLANPADPALVAVSFNGYTPKGYAARKLGSSPVPPSKSPPETT